jgi:hypothetical protein
MSYNEQPGIDIQFTFVVFYNCHITTHLIAISLPVIKLIYVYCIFFIY